LDGILYLDRAIMRSLSSNDAYSAWWAGADLLQARTELGF
jgi:hypothetical protein